MPQPKPTTFQPSVTDEDIATIVEARHSDPFRVLGPHAIDDETFSVRAYVPGAESLEVLFDGDAIESRQLHPDGFFEARLATGLKPTYRLRCRRPGGHTWETEDPYRFTPRLGEVDIYLHSEGKHRRAYEKLGAHLVEHEGVRGAQFAVWAPNASRVSVVGSFNDWDGRRHPMRYHGSSGVWEIFIPQLSEGDYYKYEIRTQNGDRRLKADPYGFRSELRPGTSSVVHDLGKYRWGDGEWMTRRRERDWMHEPVSVYEVHLGSWRRVPHEEDRFLNYREVAQQLGDYVEEMGFTHVELLPVQEHPFDGSWGYQPVGYFSPTSRFGTPDDFMYLVDHLHQRGIGVILDWVPAHFPRDDHGLRLFDGTHLYEHADPRKGEHADWGTLIFNFGRREVRNFLLASALFWLEKYHIDGIRVDAVASMIYLDYSRPADAWIPNEYGGNEDLDAISFLKEFNEVCHAEQPGVLTIAEESTAFSGVSRPTYLGGLGFSMKWNMGWMNDTLYYFAREPIHRKYHHQSLTFSLLYAFSENFVLPLSHDEVVHGKRSLLDKMPGDAWQKFANLRLLLAYQYLHPGKKLLFMGCEFGQGREWNFDQSLDWHLLDIEYHRGIRNFVGDLNRIYREETALYQGDFDWSGFEWVDFHDWENSIIVFRRRGRAGGDEVVVVFNFTPVSRQDYRVGVPFGGSWREILNSDASLYGGGDQGNLGGVDSEPVPTHGLEHSVSLVLPPLGCVVLKPGG